MNLASIKHGIYGGLAGGLAFGVLMGMMGMLPMIGNMVGIPSAPAGFFVHMVISAIIGAKFAVLLGWVASRVRGGLGPGLVYGLAWWMLGPLTLMPVFMGMGWGVNWNVAAMAHALPSLMGHLIFGAILGVSYWWLQTRTGERSVPNSAAKAA